MQVVLIVTRLARGCNRRASWRSSGRMPPLTMKTPAVALAFSRSLERVVGHGGLLDLVVAVDVRGDFSGRSRVHRSFGSHAGRPRGTAAAERASSRGPDCPRIVIIIGSCRIEHDLENFRHDGRARNIAVIEEPAGAVEGSS